VLTWNKDALDCAEYICLRWRMAKTVCLMCVDVCGVMWL
jgi:hypothetical protein